LIVVQRSKTPLGAQTGSLCSGAGRVKKLARRVPVCQKSFVRAVEIIFKTGLDGQNLTRQQNGGTEFDGCCFAAIFALLARG
jgi:hypothetical protein